MLIIEAHSAYVLGLRIAISTTIDGSSRGLPIFFLPATFRSKLVRAFTRLPECESDFDSSRISIRCCCNPRRRCTMPFQRILSYFTMLVRTSFDDTILTRSSPSGGLFTKIRLSSPYRRSEYP